MTINKTLKRRDIIGKQIQMSACVIFLKRGSVQTNIFTASRNIWNVLILWGCGISRHHLENHLRVTRRWLYSKTSNAAVKKKEKRKRSLSKPTAGSPLTGVPSTFFFFWPLVFIKSIAAKFHLEDKRPNITGCLVWQPQSVANARRLHRLQLAVVVSLSRRNNRDEARCSLLKFSKIASLFVNGAVWKKFFSGNHQLFALLYTWIIVRIKIMN